MRIRARGVRSRAPCPGCGRASYLNDAGLFVLLRLHREHDARAGDAGGGLRVEALGSGLCLELGGSGLRLEFAHELRKELAAVHKRLDGLDAVRAQLDALQSTLSKLGGSSSPVPMLAGVGMGVGVPNDPNYNA